MTNPFDALRATPSPPPDSRIVAARSVSYWTQTPASVTGMLGGYPQVSTIDMRTSRAFIAKLRRLTPSASPSAALLPRGVDCGAGIGRVTLGVLSTACAVVDVVEPVAKFTANITGGADFAALRAAGRVGAVYNVGLAAWAPAPGVQYDLIWNQWCLGHLTDAELRAYLRRCTGALAPGGWIVVKENNSTQADGKDVFDEEDSAVTRTDQKFRTIFQEAGLRLVKTELQHGFPDELYPVRFYALKPKGI